MLKYLPIYIILFSISLNSQTELKFNLASAPLLVPNIGIEVQLSERFGYQLDTSGIGGSPTPVAMMITGFSTKEGRNEIGVANTVYTVLIDNHLYA